MTDESVDSRTSSLDVQLIERARNGDPSAYAELWERHSASAANVARSITTTFDADDLVAEAFTRIYKRVLDGGGPVTAFRPYLVTTIRNVAIDWARARREFPIDHAETIEDPRFSEQATLANLDRSLAVRAFCSLPSRWQEILWYSEVEQMKPPEIASLLGIKPNAVSAVAFRAREGLRQAWIQAHIASADRDSECSWTISHLGRHARRKLRPADRTRVEDHLRNCPRCEIVAAEAEHASSRIALMLIPLAAIIGSSTLLPLIAAEASHSDFTIGTHSTSAVVQRNAGTEAGSFTDARG